MNRLTREKQKQVVAALVEGNSIWAVEEGISLKELIIRAVEAYLKAGKKGGK